MLTPQEHRLLMIKKMEDFLGEKLKNGEFQNVSALKKEFMYRHGSSKPKTDEYFDLVVSHWNGTFEFKDNDAFIRLKPKEGEQA